MREETLRQYFDNNISTDVLYMDVDGSEVKTSYDVITTNVVKIESGSEYKVTRPHLIKLCNDTLCGNLKLSHLTTIAYALVFSEYFTWDDGDTVISTVIFDWDNPEINFPINNDNLIKWRMYLETDDYTLT